jgi:TM2 domain-containing membrane protein YozV
MSLQPSAPVPEGDKSYIATVFISWFAGYFGVDHFYLGKTKTGMIKLLTLGGVGFWWFIDVIATTFGFARDANGQRLKGFDEHHQTVWTALGAIVVFAIAMQGLEPLRTGSDILRGWVYLIGVTAISVGSVFFTRWRKGRSKASTKADEDKRPSSRGVPSSIRNLLSELTASRAHYEKRAAAGDAVAGAVAAQLESLTANTRELFTRLRTKGDKSQRRIAEIEYESTLTKIAAAVERGYLLDVMEHPRLWEQPEQRVRQVQDAITVVDAQLLDNIRQANSHSALRFEVALDGLAGPLSEWQRSFDQAAGNE